MRAKMTEEGGVMLRLLISLKRQNSAKTSINRYYSAYKDRGAVIVFLLEFNHLHKRLSIEQTLMQMDLILVRFSFLQIFDFTN